ncbi:hypothetical protein QVD17_08705 [Tagetes erecta]|uniref:Uncharacterized protein n=1 Tax=Tagetes erecta TaxID=13708 RepID=A0AAD8NXQ6_TARER|nr:hypothetical protein QVD17_08705 [Tagetes erecta]
MTTLCDSETRVAGKSSQIEIRVTKKWRPYSMKGDKKQDLLYSFVDVNVEAEFGQSVDLGDAVEAKVLTKDKEYFKNTFELKKLLRFKDKYLGQPAL